MGRQITSWNLKSAAATWDGERRIPTARDQPPTNILAGHAHVGHVAFKG
jgi:hypothetical protein